MADGRDFREDMQRIGGLVQEMESIADPAVRAATKGLVQSLMDLHGAALEKALDIVAEAGEPGMSIIDRLGRDSLVSSVLILYGLHPEDLESRVVKAVERVRPQLRKQGCEVELLSVNDGAIRLASGDRFAYLWLNRENRAGYFGGGYVRRRPRFDLPGN